VVHSGIVLPDGAPEHLGDRATLWNTVEAGEVRKDAQRAREVKFAIAREMSQAQGIDLARDFVRKSIVSKLPVFHHVRSGLSAKFIWLATQRRRWWLPK
jgi:hypothetical protein